MSISVPSRKDSFVELPTPAKAGIFGTFLIKWNDRADTRAELNSLAYKINGEGDAVSVANFDSATKTYDVNVGHGAAFVTLEAKGTGTVEKPEAVDFTKGSATAELTVTAADGVTKQTYTVNFTAPQFESELAAPDAICYYTPSSPISVKMKRRCSWKDTTRSRRQRSFLSLFCQPECNKV